MPACPPERARPEVRELVERDGERRDGAGRALHPPRLAGAPITEGIVLLGRAKPIALGAGGRPAAVFDPQKLIDEPASWWWSPLRDVTDEVKAANLAEVSPPPTPTPRPR